MVLRLAGGAGQKRPRVALVEITKKDDDPDIVKECFDVVFSPKEFILQLLDNRVELAEYLKQIEQQRQLTVDYTIDHIPEFNVLKDCYFNRSYI